MVTIIHWIMFPDRAMKVNSNSTIRDTHEIVYIWSNLESAAIAF